MNAANVVEIRSHILDAVEAVVVEHGVGKLTLEVVARHAGLSKSGLLHHFPSKELLIDALVARTVECWRESMNKTIAAQTPGPFPTVRGVISCCLGEATEWNDQLRRTSTALLSVMVHCSRKDTPLHVYYRQLLSQMKEEMKDSAMADLVLAVIDGIWLRWVTHLAPIDSERILLIRELLQKLLASENKQLHHPS
jgi:AcrR family transcriptional regulator